MPLIRAQMVVASMEARERWDRAEPITAADLHERHLEDVLRYVLRRVPRQEEAEDITAEVFAAAFVGLPRFHGPGSPYLWLLGIARRKIADAWRRRGARRETLASELAGSNTLLDRFEAVTAMDEGPETAVVRAEAARVLRELMAQISPDQREALLLQHMEQLTVPEIAVVMGRSPASVKSLLQRARDTLRRRGQDYFLECGEAARDEEHAR
jgi:RNA polymerase sigma-70 factor (ECF subfamily)